MVKKSLDVIVNGVVNKARGIIRNGKELEGVVSFQNNSLFMLLKPKKDLELVIGTYYRIFDAKNNKSKIVPEKTLLLVPYIYFEKRIPNSVLIFGLPKQNYFVGIRNPETKEVRIVDYIRMVPENVKTINNKRPYGEINVDTSKFIPRNVKIANENPIYKTRPQIEYSNKEIKIKFGNLIVSGYTSNVKMMYDPNKESIILYLQNTVVPVLSYNRIIPLDKSKILKIKEILIFYS